MSAPVRVAVLVGSLRTDSLNRKIAEGLRASTGQEVQLEIVEGLADLPFYNEDLDAASVPDAAVRLRESIAAADHSWS